MEDRPDDGAEHQRGDRLPKAQPEDGNRQHADEHGRELEVRRHPRPEQLRRPAVSLVERDELGTAGLDDGDGLAVMTLADL